MLLVTEQMCRAFARMKLPSIFWLRRAAGSESSGGRATNAGVQE